jgi:hypothetical protein
LPAIAKPLSSSWPISATGRTGPAGELDGAGASDRERQRRRVHDPFFQPPDLTDAFFDEQIKLVDIELTKLKELL